jgi:hypothetical protein
VVRPAPPRVSLRKVELLESEQVQMEELAREQPQPVEQQAVQPLPGQQVLQGSEPVPPQVAARQAQQQLKPGRQALPSAPARLAQQPDASEPPWPQLPSLACPPQLSPQRPLLHPQRREGACEPSQPRPLGSSWSAFSFLVRRTRAISR